MTINNTTTIRTPMGTHCPMCNNTRITLVGTHVYDVHWHGQVQYGTPVKRVLCTSCCW